MLSAKKIQKSLVFLIVFLYLSSSEARVFVFDEESFAPYIKLRTGLTSMGSAPYEWQAASSYSGDDVGFVYGGEFGVYLRGGGFGIALGVLVHSFDPVSGGKAQDASGVELFSVETEGLAYGPSLIFDYQFSETKSYLWKVIFGGGYQFANIENIYSFTAAGQALVGGQTSLTESYKTGAAFAVIGVSTEFIMSGSTTVSVTAGYHYSMADQWKYGQGGQNFAGTHSQGDNILLEDGATKAIDWSYPFLQVGFQFYTSTIR